MKTDRVVYVHLLKHFISAAGRQLWSTEGWYTMNSIPANANGFKRQQPQEYPVNTLTEEEKQLPWGAVWGEYCDRCGVPAGFDWFGEVRKYEVEVLSKR